MDELPDNIVLFDGECGFCNRAVRFILRHEADHLLFFAPRQSQIGQELLRRYGFGAAPGTMVLIESGQAHGRSTATLRICRHLRYPWRLFAALLVIPRPLRDLAYNIVAHLRYRLAGRTSCAVYPAETAQRFLGGVCP